MHGPGRAWGLAPSSAPLKVKAVCGGSAHLQCTIGFAARREALQLRRDCVEPASIRRKTVGRHPRANCPCAVAGRQLRCSRYVLGAMNPLLYKTAAFAKSPSLLALSEWQQKEKLNPVNCAVDENGELLVSSRYVEVPATPALHS